MKTKNLKVAYSSRYTQKGYSSVPKIQMEGKWLEELGISIGSMLMVEYGEGSIHIRTLTAEELDARKRSEQQTELKHKVLELKQLERELSMVAEPIPAYTSSSR